MAWPTQVSPTTKSPPNCPRWRSRESTQGKRGLTGADPAFNIFTDICFATLPVKIIWELQMKKRKRIYLILMLSLGYV